MVSVYAIECRNASEKLEAIALTEDFAEDDGDEDDEGYGDDDWSDNTGSAFGEDGRE